jgi:hypothetical protein
MAAPGTLSPGIEMTMGAPEGSAAGAGTGIAELDVEITAGALNNKKKDEHLTFSASG